MIDKIYLPGLLQEMLDASEDYSKKFFRQKVIRIYSKCLRSHRIHLAVKIAEKYRKELTSDLRSDLSIAQQYALFAANILNPSSQQTSQSASAGEGNS